MSRTLLYIWYNHRHTRLFCSTFRPEQHPIAEEIHDSAEFVSWMKRMEVPKPCTNSSVLSGLLSKMSQGKELPRKCEIASALLPNIRLRLHGRLEESTPLVELSSSWDHEESLMEQLEKACSSDQAIIPIKGKTWFIHQDNQIALHIPMPWSDLDGNPLSEIRPEDIPAQTQAWNFEHIGKGLWFLKQIKPCLLGWSLSDGLCPLNLIQRNSYNTHLYGLYMPCFNQDEFRKWLGEQPYEPQTKAMFEDRFNRSNAENPCYFLIRFGKLPIPTRNDQVELAPGLQSGLEDTTAIRIDFKKITPYHEVQENDWLGTWTPSAKGSPGFDLDGKEIPVSEPKSFQFKFSGALRAEVCEDGSIKYFALGQSIAKLNHDELHVDPALVIDGDVGPATGNIRYSKDIVIKGQILSGYEIECGGNLHISQTPDPGVRLRTKGDLICDCGIHGKDTTLEVAGSARLNFIEDASLYCEGPIYVINHAMNAKLYSNDWIVIEGRQVQNNMEHGALIGGICNGTKGVWIHSLSSQVGYAHVVAGANLAIEAKSNDMNRRISELSGRLTQLNKQLRIKPNTPEFEALDSKEKQLIRRQLESMASLSKMRGDLEKKALHLEELAGNSHNDKAFIVVKSHILPEAELQIDDVSMRIRHPRPFRGATAYHVHRRYLIEIPEPEMDKPPIPEPKAKT